MNILIVDDEILTRISLRHSVESLGHVALVAQDAEEAITIITENKIDFIISDIMMPGISGLSLVSVLRNIYMCQMPIILISTSDNSEIRDTTQHLGANDFISKPFNIADLAYKINKHIAPDSKA